MVPELATIVSSSSNDGLFVAVHESAPGHEAGLELEAADHDDDDDGAELADRGCATSRQILKDQFPSLPRRDKLPLGQLRLPFRTYRVYAR
jgi:hypothetical protein